MPIPVDYKRRASISVTHARELQPFLIPGSYRWSSHKRTCQSKQGSKSKETYTRRVFDDPDPIEDDQIAAQLELILCQSRRVLNWAVA